MIFCWWKEWSYIQITYYFIKVFALFIEWIKIIWLKKGNIFCLKFMNLSILKTKSYRTTKISSYCYLLKCMHKAFHTFLLVITVGITFSLVITVGNTFPPLITLEHVPACYNCREYIPACYNCRNTFPACYNCQEQVPACYNCWEHVPASYNCREK